MNKERRKGEGRKGKRQGEREGGREKLDCASLRPLIMKPLFAPVRWVSILVQMIPD